MNRLTLEMFHALFKSATADQDAIFGYPVEANPRELDCHQLQNANTKGLTISMPLPKPQRGGTIPAHGNALGLLPPSNRSPEGANHRRIHQESPLKSVSRA